MNFLRNLIFFCAGMWCMAGLLLLSKAPLLGTVFILGGAALILTIIWKERN